MWANEKRLARLEVEVFENIIAFIDVVTGNTVQVEQRHDDPFPHRVLVDGREINLAPYVATKGQQEEGVTTRIVCQYVTAAHCNALRVGLTVHRSWFSSTPHAFELSPEPGFEEVFYFRSPVPGAKALLEGEGLWRDGTPVNAAWPVRDGQFATVPMGTHRVCVLPVEDEKRPEWWYWWCYLAKFPRWEKDR